MTVTVAIPVRDGAASLEATLGAIDAQTVIDEVEVLVCDSGSRDGSVPLARRFGAEVLEISPDQFGHGRTRNLLMERAQGAHVAFLTQDAVPDGPEWLDRLLAGFRLAPDVALVFGPYRPRADASPMVARELTRWFQRLAPEGHPRIDRLAESWPSAPATDLLGPPGFFTDANGCVSRAAWEQVRFRDVPYAEDRLLAKDMLRAGFAKVFVPDAAVVHSHDYSTLGWLRRSFDESRALREVYGWVEPLDPRVTTLNIYGRVGADWRWGRAGGLSGRQAMSLLAQSVAHHAARAVGGALGARSERLPPALAGRLSLEGRRR